MTALINAIRCAWPSALIWCGVLLLAPAITGIASAKSRNIQIDLEPYAGKLRQVTVRIDDREYRFLFDTAGGDTLISPRIAAAIGCKPSGRLLGFRMSGEKFETPKCPNVRLKIGDFAAKPGTVGVYDLMSLLPKELPPIDGLISLKSLEGKFIALDLRANKITIRSRAGRLRRRDEFRCRAATGPDGSEYTLFAAIRKKGTGYWFEVDSGNLDKVLIAPHAAPDFGLDEPAADSPASIGIALGSNGPVKQAARVADIIYDGVLNAAFLEKGVLLADLKAKPHCGWIPHPSLSPSD